MGRIARVALVLGALSTLACNRHKLASGFVAVRADRHVTGTSSYPIALDPTRVGTYPPDTKSGAGYLYDDVLEYRVWLHPENGASPLNGDKDYFVAFAQYEVADAFSKKSPGAEDPIVLVRQKEWIDEPRRGQFIPRRDERITEWQVKWLPGNKRSDKSIEEFLKNPKEAGP
jgi:hypothetical protein